MLGTLPDIQFVETDIDVILAEMIESFEETYYQQTGVAKQLYPGDPIRIFIYTQALRELQLREAVNQAAKQNMLAYATGEYLDHMAARYGVTRRIGSPATMRILFRLSAAQNRLIPAGTRLLHDDIYFETTDDAFANGVTEITVTAIAQVPAISGNEIPAGTELTIVDPIPFVISATTLEESIGGADRESDEELRERLYSAYETLSVAGPRQAYEELVKGYSNAVMDANVEQVTPGTVGITVLLDEGEQPNEAFLEGLQAFISGDVRRPLTDQVIVGPPEVVQYGIRATYYLLRSETGRGESLAQSVESAASSFADWQKSKLGRDINPTELTFRARQAGAKRIVIEEPVFTTLTSQQVAICENIELTFGGFEDE